MAARKTQGFLKGFDKYSKSVSLKYKRAGAFKTSCGGIATIITFFIFLSWFIIEVIDVYVRGKFITSSRQTLTELTNGLYPTYEIEQRQLFTTFALRDVDDTLTEDLHRYVTGVWVQNHFSSDNNYYTGVDCTSIWPENEVDTRFFSNIENQMCADMKGNSTELQAQSIIDEQQQGAEFNLLIDTCSRLANLTGATDCMGEEAEAAAVAQIAVEIQISTQFFSPDPYGYEKDDVKLYNVFNKVDFFLSSGNSIQQNYQVVRSEVNFKNSYIYNPTIFFQNNLFQFYSI